MGLKHGSTNTTTPRVSATEDEERLGRLSELESYLRDCVNIDPLEVQAEFIRLPGDLAYWNARYARALRAHLTSKIAVNVTYARLEPKLRMAITDAGGKATEAMVKSAVEGNADYILAQERAVEAEVEKNEVYGALDAIRSKKEMLISLGAHMRSELEGDPTLREQSRGSKLFNG